MSSHTFPIFSSRSVVKRRGGGEEPGSKGIQSFSIFSALLYTEKIATALPVLTANYSHVKVNSVTGSSHYNTMIIVTIMYFYHMPTQYHL